MPNGYATTRSTAAPCSSSKSRVEQYRWYQVVDAAQIELSTMAHAERQAGRPKTVAQEFETPKHLFGKTDMGKQLYLMYWNLSRFVHPAATTFGRYVGTTPHGGRLLKTRLQVDQNPEALAYYLASAAVMCTLPYLTALDKEQAAGLVTDLG